MRPAIEGNQEYNSLDEVCDLKTAFAFICFAPALECARVLASLLG